MRRLVGALALLLAFAMGPSGAAAIPDHLKCYKVKDPLKLTGTVDLDTPQFGADTGCTVSKAKLFCVPATATNVAVRDKATGLPITPVAVSGADPGDRICYRVKCPAAVADQQATDRFGTRTVGKFKAAFVCTPAVKGGPPTTFTCGSGDPIPADWVCDGVRDCVDGGDEVSCGSTTTTPSTTTTTTTIGVFQCGSGEPIPADWVCDGFADCVDGSDEVGCEPPGFPATGQTTCWDGSGLVIPCAGTGQDGDTQAGAPLAYKDNGDGTITDRNTGLMWEKLSDDGSIHDKDNHYSWEDAFAVKVAALNSGSFAGYTDWRVPNLKELISILNLENLWPLVSPAFNNGCTDGCAVTTCSCTKTFSYWSSSTFAGNPTYAFIVRFHTGIATVESKPPYDGLPPSYNSHPVRAVRGGY